MLANRSCSLENCGSAGNVARSARARCGAGGVGVRARPLGGSPPRGRGARSECGPQATPNLSTASHRNGPGVGGRAGAEVDLSVCVSLSGSEGPSHCAGLTVATVTRTSPTRGKAVLDLGSGSRHPSVSACVTRDPRGPTDTLVHKPAPRHLPPFHTVSETRTLVSKTRAPGRTTLSPPRLSLSCHPPTCRVRIRQEGHQTDSPLTSGLAPARGWPRPCLFPAFPGGRCHHRTPLPRASSP